MRRPKWKIKLTIRILLIINIIVSCFIMICSSVARHIFLIYKEARVARAALEQTRVAASVGWP